MITQDLGIATAYGYAKSKGYTGTEAEFAELMASYASTAQTAIEAANRAVEANTAAQSAKTSAQSSASTASIAAQTATDKASEATTAATTATTRASEASQSATSANQSAESAGTSAQTATTAATTATTKASEASESATTATAAKTDAETARDAAAQSAIAAAESARTMTIDATLTQSGQASDSKAVGDAITELKIDFDNLSERSNNLLDAHNADVVKMINSNGTTNPQNAARSVVIPVTITTQTKITATKTVASSRFAIATFTSYPVISGSSESVISNNSATSLTIAVDSTIKYVMIYFWLESADTTVTPQEVLDGMMVEFGESFTGYAPYYVPAISDSQFAEVRRVKVLMNGSGLFDAVVPSEMQQGSFEGTQVPSFNTDSKRIRTPLLFLKSGDSIDIKCNGQQFAIGQWTYVNNTWSLVRNDNTWTTADTIITATEDRYTVVVIRKADNSDILPSELVAEIQYPSIEAIKERIDKIEQSEKGAFGAFTESGHVVSHRCQPYPENTMVGLEKCAENGCKIFEIDLAFTQDNVPVLLHDTTINRTGRNEDGSTISTTINISSITYEQSLDYDFGIYKGSQYAGEKICKLQDALLYLKKIRACVIIDLLGHTYTNTQLTIMHDLIVGTGMINKTAINVYASQARSYTQTYKDTILNPSSSTNSYTTLVSLYNEFKNLTPLFIASGYVSNAEDVTFTFFSKCERLGVVTLMGMLETVSEINALFMQGCNLVYSDSVSENDISP